MELIKILFLGDITGRQGRNSVKAFLASPENKYDFVIANIENEGYLSEEDEKKYNEEINKLYKPLGVNVNNL